MALGAERDIDAAHKINHDGGGKRPAATPDLPTSLEPSSLIVGEAGDFKCLRDPPQALSVLQGGRGFFFWPHASGYIRVGGPDPPLGPTVRGLTQRAAPGARSQARHAKKNRIGAPNCGWQRGSVRLTACVRGLLSCEPPRPMRSPYQIPNRRRAKSGGSRRRVLELLASPDGCTEPLLLANGFSADLLIELVRAGLVSAQVEGMMAGDKRVEIARARITEAGRQALSRYNLCEVNVSPIEPTSTRPPVVSDQQHCTLGEGPGRVR